MAFQGNSSDNVLPISLTSQSQRDGLPLSGVSEQPEQAQFPAGIVSGESARRQAGSSLSIPDGVDFSPDALISLAGSNGVCAWDTGYGNPIQSCEIIPGWTAGRTSFNGYEVVPTNTLAANDHEMKRANFLAA